MSGDWMDETAAITPADVVAARRFLRFLTALLVVALGVSAWAFVVVGLPLLGERWLRHRAAQDCVTRATTATAAIRRGAFGTAAIHRGDDVMVVVGDGAFVLFDGSRVALTAMDCPR